MATYRRRKAGPAHRTVPAYMVSYGDMMTLLLTFFVLLCSMAKEQLAGLVAAGTGSFVRAIDSLGLPGILPGSQRAIDKGAAPPNFLYIERHVEVDPEGSLNNPRLVSPPNDRVRRATIEYLRQNKAVALPTAVAFEPGTAELTPASRRALDGFGELAQQTLSYVAIETHVGGPGDGLELSSLRAVAVARYLHDHCRIAHARIALAGYGRFRPVARPSGAQPCDRVTLLLASKPLD